MLTSYQTCRMMHGSRSNCLGFTGTERRRIGGRVGSDTPPSQKEIASSHWGASTSKSCPISMHRSTGSYLGQLRVVTWPRISSVFRKLCYQYGGCADARSLEQKGVGETPRSEQEVSSSQHRTWNSSAANVELWSSGKSDYVIFLKYHVSTFQSNKK